MKNRHHCAHNDYAISVVMGIILMIAITVAIASTTYILICNISQASGSNPTVISLNLMINDDTKNCATWIVTNVEGPTLENGKINKFLMTDSGLHESNCTVDFQDLNNDGYVNVGDTYIVTVSTDDYYVFLITDPLGAIVYRGNLFHY
jgi:hypothetical protein